MKPNPKGIFCLEGNWGNDLRRPSSVTHLLTTLDQRLVRNRPHIHKSIGTLEELDFYLGKWTQKQYQAYPILYLGFHGECGAVRVGDGRRTGSAVGMDYLEERLRAKCRGKLIHFGSCSTLDINKHRINKFLKATGALAVSGYRADIDWILSAAFDLLVLSELQFGRLTAFGAGGMKERIHDAAAGLEKKLAFRMEVRDPSWPQ